MKYKCTNGYRAGLEYKLARKKLSRAQRECRTKHKERIVQDAKTNPNTYYSHVQSRATLRTMACEESTAWGKLKTF